MAHFKTKTGQPRSINEADFRLVPTRTYPWAVHTFELNAESVVVGVTSRRYYPTKMSADDRKRDVLRDGVVVMVGKVEFPDSVPVARPVRPVKVAVGG